MLARPKTVWTAPGALAWNLACLPGRVFAENKMEGIVRRRRRKISNTLPLGALALVAAAACAAESPPESATFDSLTQGLTLGEEIPQQPRPLVDVAGAAGKEPSRSPTQLTVFWEPRTRQAHSTVPAGGTIDALVTNHANQAIDDDLAVMAVSSNGEVYSRTLESEPLEAKGRRVLSVKLSELPFQTAGAASTVRLSLRWDRAHGQNPVRINSEPLSITFDERFKTAAVRTRGEQLRQNYRKGLLGESFRPSAVRTALARNGALSEPKAPASDNAAFTIVVPDGVPGFPSPVATKEEIK